MSKFLNTLIIGAASGAAAAYFFTTEKGKAVKARIDEEIASFKEDPKAYQNQVVEKASDYKDLAVDTFQDYKTKFENGDITADDLTKAVQEKTAQVADFAKESFELIKEKTAQVSSLISKISLKKQQKQNKKRKPMRLFLVRKNVDQTVNVFVLYNIRLGHKCLSDQ